MNRSTLQRQSKLQRQRTCLYCLLMLCGAMLFWMVVGTADAKAPGNITPQAPPADDDAPVNEELAGGEVEEVDEAGEDADAGDFELVPDGLTLDDTDMEAEEADEAETADEADEGEMIAAETPANEQTDDADASDESNVEEQASGEKAEAAADESDETDADDAEPKVEKPEGKQAEAKPAAKEPQAKGEKNWLSDAVKRLLQPGGPAPARPGATPKPGNAGAAPNAAGQKPKVVKKRHPDDARAAYDKKADAWMRKAQSEIKEGRWKEALHELQRICEQPEDSLFRNDQGKWVSIRAEAHRLEGQAPSEILDAYRKEYGGLARQMLAEATEGDDISAYGRLITRYYHTEAGYEAMNRLGSLHFDRGEFGLAARCFMNLWDVRAALTADPAWRAKAALACKKGGLTGANEQLLGEANSAAKRVPLGGALRNPGEWLESVTRVAAPAQEALSEWLTFFGNARRTGMASGGAPLLLPRWTQPMTQSHPVRTQIEYLVEDLSDQGNAPLPMVFPTMVGGKVIFRTLRGVQVVDASSGRPLWETPDSLPVESLLTAGTTPDVYAGRFQIRFNRGFWNNGVMSQYSGGAAEYHPLCNLMFRNANFGMVSSDGRQLFVLEDTTALSPRQPGQNWMDSSGGDADSGVNKLTSYDLATGRPLWEIGGHRYDEALDLPLAGHFFFGPPVADGDDLFLVGESLKEKEIRLMALAPATGRLKWSQPIAVSEARIDADIGRRWWSAQVAVGNGVLVCPTTAGWLVAIDRATRSLLWGHRLAPANPGNPNDQNDTVAMVQSTPLNARWSAAPPVIVGDRLIYTPQESQSLLCLDLVSGKELWRKARNEMLYLAGVFDDRAVLVGKESVAALAIADGTQAWTLKTGAPSGRGVAVQGHFYLPLASGELWDIDLKAGTVTAKSFLPEGAGSLGNLTMYRGMLLSLNPFGMTAFEQRTAIQAEIASRKQRDPRDPWALLREAEISALNRDFAAALAALRQIPRAAVPHDLEARYRTLSIATLTADIRSDLSKPEAADDLKELESLVQTPLDRLQFRRLLAERHAARKEYAESFNAYLALSDEGTLSKEGLDLLVPLNDQSDVSVRSDLWLAGKFVDLWQQLPEALRLDLDQKVAARATAVLAQPADAQRRFVTQFGFHPAAAGVKKALAEACAGRGEFLATEHLLLELQKNSDPAIAAAATERLARLMIEFKLPADAAYYYAQLEGKFGTATVDSKTGAQVVAALRDTGTYPRDPAVETPFHWQDHELKVERMGANFTNAYTQDLSSLGSRLPFFKNHRLQLLQQEQRLELLDAATEQISWSLPLRSKAGSVDGLLAAGQSTGHHVSLLHRGVLHSLSPVDHKVLWTRTLESRMGMQGYYAGTNQNPVPQMQAAIALTNRLAVSQGLGAAAGMLSLSNRKYVCYQGRRSMTVLDTLTGDVLWTHDGIRPGTLLFGNEDFILLRPSDGRAPVALRALDGKRLEIDNLSELVAQAMCVTDRGLVLHSRVPVGTGASAKTSLRLFDLLAGKDLWKIELPRSTLLSLPGGDQLAALEPGGNFQSIDLQTGAVKLLGSVPATEAKRRTEAFAIADYDQVYLIINGSQAANYYSEGLPFIRTNGTVFAFRWGEKSDPENAKPLWQQKITNQNLILERFEHGSLLLFAARRFEQRGKLRYAMLNITALDKNSGTKLIDQNAASQSGFRSLLINNAQHYVELRSYNERIRLSPVEKRVEK